LPARATVAPDAGVEKSVVPELNSETDVRTSGSTFVATVLDVAAFAAGSFGNKSDSVTVLPYIVYDAVSEDTSTELCESE